MQKITTSLQDHQMRLMKDSAVLEKMYAQNLNYYKELTMYILAGKQKLQEVREGKLKRSGGKSSSQRTSGGCAGSQGSGQQVQSFREEAA